MSSQEIPDMAREQKLRDYVILLRKSGMAAVAIKIKLLEFGIDGDTGERIIKEALVASARTPQESKIGDQINRRKQVKKSGRSMILFSVALGATGTILNMIFHALSGLDTSFSVAQLIPFGIQLLGLVVFFIGVRMWFAGDSM